MSTKDEILQTFREGSLLTKIIMINSAIFIVVALLNLVFWLFNSNLSIAHYLQLPASPSVLLMQPWSILSFMFLHENFVHFIINILILYWFGTLFMQFFSQRDLVNVYLMGGLIGGITYMAAYAIFPALQPQAAGAMLEGASASIIALIVGAATARPNYSIRMMFIGDVKLKWIAIGAILISLLNVNSENPGGNISHLGGALIGYLFAHFYGKGTNIAGWIGKALDGLSNLFNRKPKWRMVYNQNDKNNAEDVDMVYNARKKAEEDDIDAILDKIKAGGYNSLSNDEKRRLFEASKK